MKIIEILVGSAGATKIQTHGFTGADCQEASRFLEQSLGLRLTESRTSAFYEQGQASLLSEQRRENQTA